MVSFGNDKNVLERNRGDGFTTSWNATELYVLKWFILCYMDFVSNLKWLTNSGVWKLRKTGE